MRSALIVVLVAGLSLAGCARSADSPDTIAAPAAPSVVAGNGTASASSAAEVPFRSDVVWNKMQGTDVTLCTVPPPEGKVYLMRNELSGPHVSTHLGEGTFLGHTCVYGTRERGPEGWLMDVRFTAANGDVLVANARFIRWTGVPGRSMAIEEATFEDGGTGRFQFAEGTATCYVNPQERTARYEGTIRYGRKE